MEVTMTQKQIERKSLIVSCIVNLIMAIGGFWIFSITNIQALFLDCSFSMIASCSCLAALEISKISNKKTKNYPDGLYFLEPLYSIFRTLLTLVLLFSSVARTAKAAWGYFANGVGTPLMIEPVIPYEILMCIICFGLSFFNRSQSRKTNDSSTLLATESKGNLIDGILSLGVALSAFLIKLIDINGSLGFFHYTGDFFITTIIVLPAIKEPISVFISSFRELSGGLTTNQELKRTVFQFVEKNLSGIMTLQKCDIYKIGMHIKVCIYITNNIDYKKIQIVKRNILKDICPIYENTEIVFCEW